MVTLMPNPTWLRRGGGSCRSWPRTVTFRPSVVVVNAATRTYMTLSGTSMAAAVTTGVVADIIAESRAANGGRRLRQTRSRRFFSSPRFRLRRRHLSQGPEQSIRRAYRPGQRNRHGSAGPRWWLRSGITAATTRATAKCSPGRSASPGATRSSGALRSTARRPGVFRSCGATARVGRRDHLGHDR